MGKKKYGKKPFVSVPCRADLLFVDPFGPCDTDISSFETMTIWLIQGHWRIPGLLKNLLSNMERVFGHKIAMKCLQIYVSETQYSLKRLGATGSVLSLVPKSQTNNTLAGWVLAVLHLEINSCNTEREPQEEKITARYFLMAIGFFAELLILCLHSKGHWFK